MSCSRAQCSDAGEAPTTPHFCVILVRIRSNARVMITPDCFIAQIFACSLVEVQSAFGQLLLDPANINAFIT